MRKSGNLNPYVWLQQHPTVATWLAFAIKALSFVFLYPFVLRAYSPQEINFWLSTGLLSSLIALVDLGISPTFVRLVSYALADRPSRGQSQDRAEKNEAYDLQRVIETLRYLYRFMTLLALIAASCLATWMAVGQKASVAMMVGWSFSVLAATFSFWGLQFQACLQGYQHIGEMRTRDIVIQSMALMISIMLSIAHAPILGIVAVNGVAIALLVLMNMKGAFKLTGADIWMQRPQFSSKIGRSAIDASWKSGVGVLTSYGLQQGVMAWYAASAAPQAAASFLLTMRLIQALSQFAQAPFYTKLPQLAGLYAKREIAAMADVASQGIKRSSCVLALGSAFLLVAAPLFFSWSGSNSELMPQNWLAIALIALAVERISAMLLQIFTTSNVVYWHWINGLTATVALTVGFFLWPVLQQTAIPVAWLCALSIVYAPINMALCAKTIGARQVGTQLLWGGIPIVAICIPMFFISI